MRKSSHMIMFLNHLFRQSNSHIMRINKFTQYLFLFISRTENDMLNKIVVIVVSVGLGGNIAYDVTGCSD